MFWRRLSSCFLVLFLALSGAASARAHPANEANVYHSFYLKALPGQLTLEHGSVVGGLLTQTVWPQLDRNGDHLLSPEEQDQAARELAAGLSLKVDGRPVPLKLEAREFPSFQEFFGGSFPAIKLRLTAPLPPASATGLLLTLRDDTWTHFRGLFSDPQIEPTSVTVGAPRISEDGRLTEVLVGAGAAAGKADEHRSGGSVLPGLALSNGPLTVPGASANANSPAVNAPFQDLDLRKAPLFPDHGKIVYAAPKAERSEAAGIKGLLGKRLSLGVILLGLGAAVLAGMAHALAPGHGKAMVGAYLVGSRGTVGDAVLLGIVVTITHTIGVYVLGFLCLWLTTRIQAETVGNWLGVLSGALVLGMGFWLFQRGLLAYHGLRELPGHSHGAGGHSHGHSHSHAHAHEHGHAHAHSHDAPAAGVGDAERRPPSDSPLEDYRRGEPISAGRRQTKWDLIGLGVAGGIVPCFDALAILVAAVNLGNIPFGLALIAAFSLGLAAVLVLIGILMVKAKDLMARFTEESRWVKAMPAVSGAVLFFLGAWLTLESLAHAGVVHFG